MIAARFIIGRLPSGEELWAAIDPNVHHIKPQVEERRFGAYMRPFTSEEAARAALASVGCQVMEPEPGRRDRRPRGGPVR